MDTTGWHKRKSQRWVRRCTSRERGPQKEEEDETQKQKKDTAKSPASRNSRSKEVVENEETVKLKKVIRRVKEKTKEIDRTAEEKTQKKDGATIESRPTSIRESPRRSKEKTKEKEVGCVESRPNSVRENRRPKVKTPKKDRETEEKTVQKKETSPRHHSPSKESKESKEKVEDEVHTGPQPPGSNKKKVAKIKLTPEVEAAMEAFIKYHMDENKAEDIANQFKQQICSIVPGEGEHKKCCENPERNRNNIPCLDATRIVLQSSVESRKSLPTDYIHANKIILDQAGRQYIAAQAPKENTAEDFWKMIYQETCPVAVVLCNFFENGEQSCHQFWPLEAGKYMYCGKMFVNNKKVEHQNHLTVYTVEVLPDGCSNSHICIVLHCTTWQSMQCPSSRMIVRLLRAANAKTIGGGPAVVVSSEGIGRSCTLIVMDVVLFRINKGIPSTKVLDLCMEIRKQRALAIPYITLYAAAHSFVFDYIRSSIPKHTPMVAKFNRTVADSIKAMKSDK